MITHTALQAFEDYDVVWDPRLPDLITAVKAKLADGYVPLGGLLADGPAFYQAVGRPAGVLALTQGNLAGILFETKVSVPVRAQEPDQTVGT